MILRVGPYLYRVRRVAGYIEHEGQQCLGLCDNDAHELLVSDVTGELQQVQVLCHEYMEAWLYHFGPGLGDGERKEAACDLFGLAMTQFVLDYTHQIRQELGLLAVVDGCTEAKADSDMGTGSLESHARSPASPAAASEGDLPTSRNTATSPRDDAGSRMGQHNAAPRGPTPPAIGTAAWAADCLVRSHYHPPDTPEDEAGWVVCVIEPGQLNHPVAAAS